MNQKGYIAIVIPVVVLLLLCIGIYYAVQTPNQPIIATNSPTVTYTTSPLVSITPSITPTPNTQPSVFKNEYLQVTIPTGWTAVQPNKRINVGNCDNKENCATSLSIEPDPTALNITKGNYILYINARASQASGVEGGRFAEISIGAPSSDAINIDPPADPCGTKTTQKVSGEYVRNDLFISKQTKQDHCAAPSDNATVWYFSYVNQGQGYFNYYARNNEQRGVGYVITMAYNSQAISMFPKKDSAELKAILTEMTDIIKGLTVTSPNGTAVSL